MARGGKLFRGNLLSIRRKRRRSMQCECPLWVKAGKAQNEYMLSGLPPIATDARTSAIGSFVPLGDIEFTHSITSSVVASRVDGTVKPKAKPAFL